MKQVLLVMVYSCAIACVQAQKIAAKIGETVTDFPLANIYNYDKGDKMLHDFEGKVVLIDFWATNCGVCIESMPKMAALRKKYPDQLAFFYVASQGPAIIEKFFNKRPDLKALGVPMLIGDTLLNNKFPHISNPYIVWIGKDRTIKALTIGKHATEANIEKFIKNLPLYLPVSNSVFDFDKNSMFVQNELMLDNLLGSSALTDYVDGLSGNSSGKPGEDKKSYSLYNLTMSKLYNRAYENSIRLMDFELPTRVFFEVTKSSSQLFQGDSFKNMFAKMYCYQLIYSTPSTKHDKAMLSFMQRDLDHYFGIRSRIETRQLNAYVISTSDSFKDTASGKKYTEDKIGYSVYHNTAISALSVALTMLFPATIPITYDKPSADILVNLVLQKEYNTLAEVRADLKKVGLIITEKVVELPCIILEDQK